MDRKSDYMIHLKIVTSLESDDMVLVGGTLKKVEESLRGSSFERTGRDNERLDSLDKLISGQAKRRRCERVHRVWNGADGMMDGTT